MNKEELIKCFIEEYNAIIQELNDESEGIREEEPELERYQEITLFSQADLDVVRWEDLLRELYLEIKHYRKHQYIQEVIKQNQK